MLILLVAFARTPCANTSSGDDCECVSLYSQMPHLREKELLVMKFPSRTVN